jgi:hypothetical protein
LLRDRDAGLLGAAGCVEAHGLTGIVERAREAVVEAAEDLKQGGFTSPVLSNEPHHLAEPNLKADPFQRLDSPESARHVRQLQYGFTHEALPWSCVLPRGRDGLSL